MGVTILSEAKTQPKSTTKPKAKAKKTPKSVAKFQDRLNEIADEICDIDDEIEPLQAKLKELQLKRKPLEDEARGIGDEHFKKDEKVMMNGEKACYELSAKSNTTEITDKESVRDELEKVEPGLFITLANVGITELRKYLTPKVLEKVTETFRSGTRKLKCVTKNSI